MCWCMPVQSHIPPFFGYPPPPPHCLPLGHPTPILLTFFIPPHIANFGELLSPLFEWMYLINVRSTLYFHIIHFKVLIKINFRVHDTNVTKAYWTSVVRPWENHMFNACSNKSDNHLQEAQHRPVHRRKGQSGLLATEK